MTWMLGICDPLSKSCAHKRKTSINPLTSYATLWYNYFYFYFQTYSSIFSIKFSRKRYLSFFSHAPEYVMLLELLYMLFGCWTNNARFSIKHAKMANVTEIDFILGNGCVCLSAWFECILGVIDIVRFTADPKQSNTPIDGCATCIARTPHKWSLPPTCLNLPRLTRLFAAACIRYASSLWCNVRAFIDIHNVSGACNTRCLRRFFSSTRIQSGRHNTLQASSERWDTYKYTHSKREKGHKPLRTCTILCAANMYAAARREQNMSTVCSCWNTVAPWACVHYSCTRCHSIRHHLSCVRSRARRSLGRC